MNEKELGVLKDNFGCIGNNGGNFKFVFYRYDMENRGLDDAWIFNSGGIRRACDSNGLLLLESKIGK